MEYEVLPGIKVDLPDFRNPVTPGFGLRQKPESQPAGYGLGQQPESQGEQVEVLPGILVSLATTPYGPMAGIPPESRQAAGEVLTTIGTGAAADAVGGWNAMIKGGYAGDTVDKTRENMTFQPRSEGAQSAFQGLGKAMEGPMNWLLEKRDVAEGAANKTIGTVPAALLYSAAAGLLAAWPGSRGGSNALRQGSKQMMRGGNKPPRSIPDMKADEMLKQFDKINESLTQSEKIMRDVAGDDWHKLSIQEYRDRAIQRAFREKYPHGEKFADKMVEVRAQYEAGHERLGKIDEAYNALKYPPEGARYNDPDVDLASADQTNVTPIGPGRKQRGSLGDPEASPEVNQLAATTAGKAGATPEVTEVKVPKMTAREFQGTVAGPKSLQTFNQRLSEARQGMSAQGKAQVDKFVPEGFDGNLYMNAEQTAGFALSKDGYVSHLWKGGDSVRDAMGAALTKARAAGAKNLDAFDTFLAQKYMERGAVEKSRGPFDPSRLDPEDANALRGTGPGGSDPSMVSMDIGGQYRDQKHSNLLGPRPQQSLERWRGKGEPASVAKHFTAEREAQVRQAIEMGLSIGGEKWYWLGGLLDDFIDNLGMDLGVQRFDAFMDMNAAMSGKSKTMAQIKRASVLYQRHVAGQQIKRMNQPPGSKQNPKGAKRPYFPKGYGHLAHETHMGALGNYHKAGGKFDPVMQPKYAGYSENLKGNYDPGAIDTHQNMMMSGGEVPVGSRAPGYAPMEDHVTRIGSDYGLQTGEGQAASWTGGGELGYINVDPGSRRNMSVQMNERIAKTAEVLGIPEAEAKVRFIMGDTKLYTLIGAIGAGLLMEGEEATDNNALNDL